LIIIGTSIHTVVDITLLGEQQLRGRTIGGGVDGAINGLTRDRCGLQTAAFSGTRTLKLQDKTLMDRTLTDRLYLNSQDDVVFVEESTVQI